MGFKWEVPPDEAFVELADAYATAVHTAVYTICQRYATEIENAMKSEASWQDQTGNARQSLHTEVEEVVNQMVSIILSHGVDYGVFLELSNQGRYSIISPMLDRYAPKIWADVQALFR